jgi:hypothetical protein
MTDPTAGWYEDPDGKPSERYWDGSKWTSKTRPRTSQNLKNKKNKSFNQKFLLIPIPIILVSILIFFVQREAKKTEEIIDSNLKALFPTSNPIEDWAVEVGRETVACKLAKSSNNQSDIEKECPEMANEMKVKTSLTQDECFDLIYHFLIGYNGLGQSISSIDVSGEPNFNCVNSFGTNESEYGKSYPNMFCDEWNRTGELREGARQRIKDGSPLLALQMELYC